MKKAKQSKAVRKSDFHRLRVSVGLSRQEEAENFLQISRRTLERWDKEDSPEWAKQLMRYHDGQPIAHGPEWQGWKFSRGSLINKKKGLRFSPRNLELWPTVCAKLGKLEAEQANRRKCPLRPLWEPLRRLFAVR